MSWIGRVATPELSAAGHGRRDLDHQARVEGLGNQVFRAEGQVGDAIGRGHDVGLLGLRQLGDGVHGGDLHLAGDGGGAAIERAAEDVGEAQHVVDLVRIVRTAGGDDGVVAHGLDFFRQDFRVGLASARSAAGGHLLDHPASARRRRQAQEDVGAGITSARVRASVSRAKRSLSGSISSVRPL
jgi:hypothetical protein